MQIDEHGTKLDCFGYDGKKDECIALNDWYTGNRRNRCTACPFYKSHEQMRRELNGDFSMSKRKKKYYRTCVLCRARLEQSEMTRLAKDPKPWVCKVCKARLDKVGAE